MKLNEYADIINRLIKEGHGDAEMVYGCDEEGNEFKPVQFHPWFGAFSRADRSFIAFDESGKVSPEEQELLDMLSDPVDAVCVN